MARCFLKYIKMVSSGFGCYSLILEMSSRSYGTFATGGCDGFVNVWDGNNKKRLYQVKFIAFKIIGLNLYFVPNTHCQSLVL